MTPKVDQSLFDKAAFKSWLESHADKAIVGRSMSVCLCPLAKWLASLGFRVEIGSDGLAIIIDGSVAMFPAVKHMVSMPPWASQFVKKIDQVISCELVSKERALDTLSLCRSYEIVSGESEGV